MIYNIFTMVNFINDILPQVNFKNNMKGGKNMMNIGKTVRSQRLKKQLSQKELAQIVGVNDTMICQIEKGLKIPSLPTAFEIAKALECTLDELCREESA